jgi:predicted nucleic acid-binding protein
LSARRGLTLDAGALIAFERGEQRVRALLREASTNDRLVTVPATVVAEAWRGGRHRWLADLLNLAVIESLTDELARRAGELLARTGTSNTVDATVAVSASQRGDIIVTSDPDDMQLFADDLPAVRVLRL